MMPADFAGALQAIKDKFEAEWVSGSSPLTRIAEVNKTPSDPWPPREGKQELAKWVLIAPEGAAADHPGFGLPGDQVYLYRGLISIHVYVPVGQGTDEAFSLAVQAGEIFRGKTFYNDVTPRCFIRTLTPRVDGGGPGDDDGVWFRVTSVTPFEYWHRG